MQRISRLPRCTSVVDGDGVAADDDSAVGTADFAGTRVADDVVNDTVADGGIPVRYAVRVADGDGVAADGGSVAGTAGFADTRVADDVPAESDTDDDVDAKQDHFCYQGCFDAATH